MLRLHVVLVRCELRARRVSPTSIPVRNEEGQSDDGNIQKSAGEKNDQPKRRSVIRFNGNGSGFGDTNGSNRSSNLGTNLMGAGFTNSFSGSSSSSSSTSPRGRIVGSNRAVPLLARKKASRSARQARRVGNRIVYSRRVCGVSPTSARTPVAKLSTKEWSGGIV